MVSKALLKSGKTFKNLLTEILRFITKEYKNLLSWRSECWPSRTFFIVIAVANS